MTKNIGSLKIGFILDDGLDKPDGVQQYVLTLGKWFEKNGHKVRYLVGQSKRKDISGLIELSKNIKVTFNGNKMSIPVWPYFKKIKSVLREEDFDVIHVQTPFSPVMGGRVLASAPKKTAIVGTFHILPLNDSLPYKLGNILTSASIKPGIAKVDKFFSVSKPAQQFSKDLYGINSEILGNPVNIPKKPMKIKDFRNIKTIRIVYLGRLVRRKGCMTLLKAINALSDGHKSKISVHIGGTGVDKKSLEHYVESNNLENTVTFHGFIDEADKFKFLNNAELAIFPSYGGESFGIVLIEAMAAAGPVVLAGDNPGYRSVMETDDTLFSPKDYRDLSHRIASFLDNKIRLNDIFSRQQHLVKKYDIEEIGQRLLVNYRSIVQNKNK